MAFNNLQDKLSGVFKKLRNKGKISESDVKEAMREVRLALLEADVNYKVAKDFTNKVAEKCIGENVFEKVNSSENLLTAKECIEKALYISGLDYSTAEIKDIFSLSDQRFERPLEYVSGEIWQISTAVNFALGKDIFCYPWLNEFDIFRYETACELGTIDFLKNKGKIVLVPSSQKNKLKRLCDHTMEFSKGMFSFK